MKEEEIKILVTSLSKRQEMQLSVAVEMLTALKILIGSGGLTFIEAFGILENMKFELECFREKELVPALAKFKKEVEDGKKEDKDFG